jgi:hypothetical protein
VKKFFVASLVCALAVLAITGCPDEKQSGGAAPQKQEDKGW